MDADTRVRAALVLSVSANVMVRSMAHYQDDRPSGWNAFCADLIALDMALAPEDVIPQKYYLSAKACAGILRRAERPPITLTGDTEC